MFRRTVSAIIVAMLLMSTLVLAFDIQHVKADAVEVVVDTEVGESRFTPNPSRQSPNYWIHVQDHDSFNTRAYGSNFWYTLCGADGTGEPLYYGTWQVSLPSSGIYEVFVWIPNPDTFQYDGRTYMPTQSAIYQIYHKNGMDVRTVNQRLRTGGWYSLGAYTFDTTASVILNDRTGEPYLSTILAFDAVKFVGDGNRSPYEPYNPSPYPHENAVLVTTDLGWSGGDPDAGDTVTYDVHFGLSSSPPLVSSGQSATTYNLGILSQVTTYYWKIVATDNHGASTEGPVWDFTTQSLSSNPPAMLYNGYVSPSSGYGSTLFSYRVTYSDPEGNPPTMKYVYFDDGFGVRAFTMTKTSGDYLSGAVFEYSTYLVPEGSHSFYFFFGDSLNNQTVRLPEWGEYSGPNVEDFFLEAAVSQVPWLAILQGGSDTQMIKIVSRGGFNQPVQLVVSAVPLGVVATLTPQLVLPPPNGLASSILTISVGSNTAVGTTGFLTVTGISGQLTRSTQFYLVVVDHVLHPEIYVLPRDSVFTVGSLPLGSRFNVSVRVRDMPVVAGVYVLLSFDDSIINVTQWWAPIWSSDFFLPLDPYTGGANAFPNSPDLYYVHVGPGKGEINVGVSKGGFPPRPPWGHDGIVAIFEFAITAAPPEGGALSCVLDVGGSLACDDMSVPIVECVTTSGQYEYAWTAAQPKFLIGNTVQTTASLDVMEGPGLDSTIIGTIPVGMLGQVIGGPAQADGYIWWNVDYDNGVQGWSAENWLQLAPAPPTPDFSISADPKSLVIQPGNSGKSTITITSIEGFCNLVELSRSGMPPGVTTSLPLFTAPPAGGSEALALTVAVDVASLPGDYDLIVSGTSDLLSHSVHISLKVTSRPPSGPVEVSQYKSDGVTLIEEGRTTPESTVVFRAIVADPDGDSVRLEIELRQMAEPFTGEPTPETISDFVPSGSQAMVSRPGLWNGDYHWRYRAKDSKGACSIWTEFGFYEGKIDFTVYVGSDPHISYLSPSSGAPGMTMTIEGANFGPKEKLVVAFGVPLVHDFAPDYAEIISANEEEILILVPEVVLPEGDEVVDVWVKVQVGGIFDWKLSNMVQFAYKKPVIRALRPSSGIPESEVVIEGEHFGTGKDRNNDGKVDATEMGSKYWVKFGRSSAEIISWEDNRIIVKAPADFGSGKDDIDTVLMLLGIAWDPEKGGVKAVADKLFEWFKIPIELDLFAPEVAYAPDVDGVKIGVRVGTYAGISDSAFWTYEFDSAIISGGSCPIEFRVYNNQGNTSGLVNGEKKSEIPYSHSFGNSVIVYSANESYHYEVKGQDIGTYNLTIVLITSQGESTFAAIDIPTSSGATHQYTIDWAALSLGEEGVTVRLDHNGDGVFEHAFTSDSKLTRDEFLRVRADINGDGKVNLKDVFQVALAFGTVPGDSRWNSDADINGDGRINLLDFFTVCLNFGKIDT